MIENKKLIVKDFFLTNEEFELVKDLPTKMLNTSPKPSKKNLSKYYASSKYISHQESSYTFFSKIYFFARALALWPKSLLISKHFHKPKSALDIGSGSGSFVRHLSKKKWNVKGYEPSNKAREFAEKNNVAHVSSLKDLSPLSYSLITFWHSLEHVYSMEETLKKSIKALEENGIIMIACPNYTSWDAKYYGSAWAAYDVPRHLRHFAPESLKRILEPMGMKQLSQHPLLFDALYISMLSEKNLKSKLLFIKGLFFGLYSNIRGFFYKNYSSQIYIFKKTI